MSGTVSWHRFERLDDAAEALAEAVAVRLRELLREKKAASLCVPGGSTPVPFLEALGRRDLDWGRVTILPTDERFVAPDDPASNERMIRSHFAPVSDGRARFFSFHHYGSDIEAAAAALCARLAEEPPIDLLVSGMGGDGHIASLFPADEEHHAAVTDSGVVVARPSGLPARLSLSHGRLREAGWAALLVSGSVKEAVLAEYGRRPELLPVDCLLARPQGLDVYWASA